MRQIAFEEPRTLKRHERAIPTELATIVPKTLEKNPADRYASAQELADDLRRFLEDKPIKAKPPTLLHHAAKWGRRHRPLVWSVTVIALALIAGLGWLANQRAVRRMATEQVVKRRLTSRRPGRRRGGCRRPSPPHGGRQG